MCPHPLHRPVTNFCLLSSTSLLGMCVPNTYKMTHHPGVAFDIIIVIERVEHRGVWETHFTDLSIYMESNAIGNVDGCHNKFALVGFGEITHPPEVYSTTNGDKLLGFNAFLTLFKSLNNTIPWRLSIRDGYRAIRTAMTDIPLRNSTKNCHVERTMLLVPDVLTLGRLELPTALSTAELSSLLAQLNIRLHYFALTYSEIAGFSQTEVYEARHDNHVCKRRLKSVWNSFAFFGYTNYFNLTSKSGGFVWNLLASRLDCLITGIVSQARFKSGDCINCSCNGNGVMQCQSMNESASAECACIAGNGLVSTFRHYYTVEHCN